MLNYEIRHFNTPLLRFSATEDSSSPDITIIWQDDSRKNLLPLGLTVSGEGISRWLRHRTIPRNRAYVNNLLSKCGLSVNRPIGIIKASLGMSLTDCYWITEEGFRGTFEQYNLYDNRLSQILAKIAFTGFGSNVRSSLLSSPEFTTNGMLPKCWRRQNGIIKLYKGGTKGAANTGNEPYSEYYAAQIAEILSVNSIPYTLSKWKGELCSVCDLFTSKEYPFVPIGRLVTSGGIKEVEAYCRELGQNYLNALHDMFVLDAVIYNTDRHYGNFGFLVDNITNMITRPAPLFDNGNSLFNLAGSDALTSVDSLCLYADTLTPCVYDDFAESAKRVLRPEHREGLRHLLDFKFKRHSRYNLPPKRLKLIEKLIHKRAAQLLS